jgi:hypothetical protein
MEIAFITENSIAILFFFTFFKFCATFLIA